MSGTKSATLPTGTKVEGPAHVIDSMVGKAAKPVPKVAAKKAVSKKSE